LINTHTNLQRWERHAEWPLAAAALLFLGVFSVQVLVRPQAHEAHVLWAVDWTIWGVFILDYVARLCLATNRWRWFLHPVTNTGRIIAVLLMIGGISLVGVVTAALASWIIQRVAEEETASQVATAAHIDELRSEIRELAQELRGRQ
jgi:hypothetical protein